jgi:hypothetical protein
VLVVVGIAFAAEAFAAEAEVGAGTSLDVRCARDGQDERRIEIVSEAAGHVPCQTWYTKWGTRTQKANAANAEGYCEQIAGRIRGNLEAAGFDCRDETDAASVPLASPDRDVSAAPPPRIESASTPSSRIEVPSTSSAPRAEDAEDASVAREEVAAPDAVVTPDDVVAPEEVAASAEVAAPEEAPAPDEVAAPGDVAAEVATVGAGPEEAAAPPAPEIATGSPAPERVAVAARPVAEVGVSPEPGREVAPEPREAEAVVAARAHENLPAVSAAPPARRLQRRVTPARLRAHVDAFMTERPGCSADVDGAKYAVDRSFAVVQWSCEIGSSGYASHLLVVFADGTAPASLRIGGALTKDSEIAEVDDAGRIQVLTKLYRPEDPKCCPSVRSVDVYRVERSADASSIEPLVD